MLSSSNSKGLNHRTPSHVRDTPERVLAVIREGFLFLIDKDKDLISKHFVEVSNTSEEWNHAVHVVEAIFDVILDKLERIADGDESIGEFTVTLIILVV